MPASAQPPRAQTIKQAKASYKARGQPSISDTEKRQLDRAIELDRRAWRIKEAEKRRVEAAQKRAEKERKEREERVTRPLGSQRRIDRFGYKSSQMHLGAFVRKPAIAAILQKENASAQVTDEDDGLGDMDLDEESILGALDGTIDSTPKISFLPPAASGGPGVSRAATSVISAAKTPVASMDDGFDVFFDELGSSTQIARELNADPPTKPTSAPHPVLDEELTDEDDFDLTVEDLEELASSAAMQKKMVEDRRLMPPPPLPTLSRQQVAASDIGFTLAELEDFVADDLQLTQADPG